MQPVGNGSDRIAQELSGGHLPSLFDALGEGKLARAVDADGQVEPAFSSLHLCDVDMEIADGIAFEALALRLVVIHIREPGDTMARAGQ